MGIEQSLNVEWNENNKPEKVEILHWTEDQLRESEAHEESILLAGEILGNNGKGIEHRDMKLFVPAVQQLIERYL